jgi:hypothetical protein
MYMDINNKLFENIVIIGRSDDKSTIFDEIEDQEAKMEENKDLYDAFEKINKVLKTLSRFNEIQTVAPAIDVNNGHLKIDGVCKHDTNADAKDMDAGTTAEDASSERIIDTFVGELAAVVPHNLNVEYEVLEDNMAKMGKKQFTILVTRRD